MDSNQDEFFEALQTYMLAIKELAHQYGYDETFSMCLIAGLYIKNEEGEDALRMMSDFYVSGEDELDEIMAQATTVFQEQMRQADAEDMGPSWLDMSTSEGWGIDDWMEFINKNGKNES
jgi:hypothetical protein